jgi:hypothetical protein
MNENQLKWADALESGEFKQGQNALCTIHPTTKVKTYCCLGVACEIYQREVGDLSIEEHDINDIYGMAYGIHCMIYDDSVGLLPDKVAEWLDCTYEGTLNSGIGESCLECNDVRRESFQQIAKRIRDGELHVLRKAKLNDA